MNAMPLTKARGLAERVCAEIAPYVARVEIAGSIRRGRLAPQDIDLIILPKPGPAGEHDLANAVQGLTLARECGQTSGRVVNSGPQRKTVLLRGSLFQCDLFIADYGKAAAGDLFTPVPATPCNFGALMLTYTGSKEHNIEVVRTARERGWKWHPSRGLMIFDGPNGAVSEVLSVDEHEIFQRLFGRWIEPERREVP